MTDADRQARLDAIRRWQEQAYETGARIPPREAFLLAVVERVERERDVLAARIGELVLDVTALKVRAEAAEAQVGEWQDHPPGIGDDDIQRIFRERDEARRERDEARRKLHAWQHATPIIQERDAARAEAEALRRERDELLRMKPQEISEYARELESDLAAARLRIEEYQREVERRDELLAGADADLTEARRERDRLGALIDDTDALRLQRMLDFEAARARVAELEAALENLMDWQNGPPLATPKYERGWGGAMERARAALAAGPKDGGA